MMSPSDILVAVRTVAARGGAISETERGLHVNGDLHAADFDTWRAIVGNLPAGWISDIVMKDDIEGAFDVRNIAPQFLSGVRILIRKEAAPGEAVYFTADGASKLFHDEGRLAEIGVLRVAEGLTPFRTRRCQLIPWTIPDTQPIAHQRLQPLRPFARALSADAVPQDVAVWLIDGEMPEQSPVFAAWRDISSRWLAASLSSEAWVAGGNLHLAMQGPRKRVVKMENSSSSLTATVFLVLSRAAAWVYEETREAEVRHTLVAHEIAREWPGETDFFAGFERVGGEALEAARMAYRLHVQGATEKTLKALGDLRKTLADDVKAVSQQSRDLLSGVWRDLTVALTAVIGRVLLILGDKPAANSAAVRLMLAATAAFIAISAGATLYANNRFSALAKDGITAWRTKLYGFLDDTEMQTFALGPLNKARAVYRRLILPVVVLYALTILGLSGFALHTSDIGSQPSASAVGGSAVPPKTVTKQSTSPLTKTPVKSAKAGMGSPTSKP